MFVRAFTLVLAIAASVIAVPDGTVNQCNTGSMQCCDTMPASELSPSALNMLGLTSTQGVTAFVNCSPFSLVGAGSGGKCTQQPVCCSNMKNDGIQVVSVDCSPIDF